VKITSGFAAVSAKLRFLNAPNRIDANKTAKSTSQDTFSLKLQYFCCENQHHFYGLPLPTKKQKLKTFKENAK
jgi:hypothetical protein